jgi:hypothetical protein
MTTSQAGYIHWVQPYGRDCDHATAEVDSLARVGDLVITPTGSDGDQSPVYRISEILTEPYAAEGPSYPAPTVVRVRLVHLYTVPGHAGRTIATDESLRRNGLSRR